MPRKYTGNTYWKYKELSHTTTQNPLKILALRMKSKLPQHGLNSPSRSGLFLQPHLQTLQQLYTLADPQPLHSVFPCGLLPAWLVIPWYFLLFSSNPTLDNTSSWKLLQYLLPQTSSQKRAFLAPKVCCIGPITALTTLHSSFICSFCLSNVSYSALCS